MREITTKITALLMISMALLAPLFLLAPADAEPTTAFEGTVTDYVTDEPLEGASVMILGGVTGKIATTDESGNYRVELEKGGDYSFVVTRDGYHDAYKEEMIMLGQTKVVDFILLPFKTFVSGRVTDIDSGEGIQEAYVEFRNEDLRTNGVTDEEGNYEIGIEEGTYEIMVRAQDYGIYREDGILIEQGENNRVDVEMEEFSQGMYGTVTDEDGTPLEGAQVLLNGNGGTSKCATGEDGGYRICVRPGSYKVTVNYKDHPSTKGNVDIPRDEMVEKDWTIYENAPKSVIMRILEWIWNLIGMGTI
ncbi:MAG: carboxypeptidase-like regulatory domain-containing protein [Thermoplasmatota archaeon]